MLSLIITSVLVFGLLIAESIKNKGHKKTWTDRKADLILLFTMLICLDIFFCFLSFGGNTKNVTEEEFKTITAQKELKLEEKTGPEEKYYITYEGCKPEKSDYYFSVTGALVKEVIHEKTGEKPVKAIKVSLEEK